MPYDRYTKLVDYETLIVPFLIYVVSIYTMHIKIHTCL